MGGLFYLLVNCKFTATQNYVLLEGDITEDLNKYVGIPYLFNGETKDGCDCAGLVLWFYRDHGWKPDNYPKPKDTDWYLKDQLYMQRFLMKNYDMTRNIELLKFGDLIYYLINGEGHIGIYLGYGKFLSTFPKLSKYNGGISFIDRTRFWFDMPGVEFKAGFRRRGDN